MFGFFKKKENKEENRVEKPKMKLHKINNIVTIVFTDGKIGTRVISSEEFDKLYQFYQENNEQEVRSIMFPQTFNTELFNHDIYDVLVQSGLFHVENGALYRNGVNLSIPKILAEEFIKRFKSKKGFEALDNFWMWLSLCPNEESREDAFRFLEKHGFHLTNEGMVLAYRRVVSKDKEQSNKKYIDFISNSWLKIKAQKKSPKNYNVYTSNGNYTLRMAELDELVGNLDELYHNLEKEIEIQFTDDHTHSFDYKIGVENRMDRREGDQSNKVSCSKGFHVASKVYDYSRFGDTCVLVAFNPMDILSVPNGEDGKMRVCAFTIIAVLDEDEENNVLDLTEFDDILGDFYKNQVNNLQEMLDKNTPYELRVNNILSKAIENNSNIMDRANELIKNRVVQI